MKAVRIRKISPCPREWRRGSFEEFVGQDNVVVTESF